MPRLSFVYCAAGNWNEDLETFGSDPDIRDLRGPNGISSPPYLEVTLAANTAYVILQGTQEAFNENQGSLATCPSETSTISVTTTVLLKTPPSIANFSRGQGLVVDAIPAQGRLPSKKPDSEPCEATEPCQPCPEGTSAWSCME